MVFMLLKEGQANKEVIVPRAPAQKMIEGSLSDPAFRLNLNQAAAEGNHPIPFTYKKDLLIMIQTILDELDINPGHLFITNSIDNDWIVVVYTDADEKYFYGVADNVGDAINYAAAELQNFIYGEDEEVV